jgi:hypothetical protein
MQTPGVFGTQKPPVSLKSPSFTTDEMNLENGAGTKEVQSAGKEHQDPNELRKNQKHRMHHRLPMEYSLLIGIGLTIPQIR